MHRYWRTAEAAFLRAIQEEKNKEAKAGEYLLYCLFGAGWLILKSSVETAASALGLLAASMLATKKLAASFPSYTNV